MSVVIPSLRAAIAVPPWVKNDLWRRARAVPSLDLRLADSKSLTDAVTGASLVTFTRASAKTVTNSARVLETVGIDVPAFDHNPVTGESLGLLVEEQRTNLLLRSEEFDNASWGKIRASVTANATTSPAGTLTADKLVEDATASNSHQIVVSPGTASGIHTGSIYAKAAERTQVAIRLDIGTLELAIFNLSTGTVISTTSGITSSITPVGDSWYRLTATLVSAASVINFIPQIATGGTNVYTGDGTSGIYIWGAQLEAGAFPTSYIPTTAAAVTRSADVASITGSAFSSWYRQDEGTVFAIGSTKGVAGSSAFIQFDDTTTSERIGLRRTQNQDRLACIIVDGGATQANNSIVSPAFIDGATGRCALAFASNNVNISFKGALSTLDTTATIPTVTQATIGTGAGASYINNCISRITYWPQRFPDSTLQQITQ